MFRLYTNNSRVRSNAIVFNVSSDGSTYLVESDFGNILEMDGPTLQACYIVGEPVSYLEWRADRQKAIDSAAEHPGGSNMPVNVPEPQEEECPCGDPNCATPDLAKLMGTSVEALLNQVEDIIGQISKKEEVKTYRKNDLPDDLEAYYVTPDWAIVVKNQQGMIAGSKGWYWFTSNPSEAIKFNTASAAIGFINAVEKAKAEPRSRWVATVRYGKEPSRKYYFDEFHELGMAMEAGPDWTTVTSFNIRYNL